MSGLLPFTESVGRFHFVERGDDGAVSEGEGINKTSSGKEGKSKS